ncbi:hypothetical protein A2272_00220 [Candidatus Peregrinibacteria bacterium RIFOXYA12_FULL_33_12]|nr:MAG: hypothetical protein A2263_06650 [Candidatus Peregrinibacteria bacterium RIFOXYA2_FULL_33_21]OGJ46643.1 MAG: hypothetical protein A2272_00220 [Candidatus Peregrinibacteria bacterium RIFOXYA12_FULL_33_12]OGJ51146.1 MAG: hypothetical protein A2307_04735 [Candidatus Peregrinibacteria bacterium RIFOXYB2_FULL_33_20]
MCYKKLKMENLLTILRPNTLDLAERAFPGYRVVFLQSFMYASRNSYPLEWIARELPQNCCDHNQEHPGTLDGVDCTEEDLDDGVKRLTFAGPWAFRAYDKLITFGSDKSDVKGKAAGGNGIGFKQAALRLMRDYGVKKVEVLGEGWKVHYEYVTKDDINDKLPPVAYDHRPPPFQSVTPDEWEQIQAITAEEGALLAKVEPVDNHGQFSYIIETDNPAVIEHLREFKHLGVSKENRHLRQPHFQGSVGSITWLPLAEDPSLTDTAESDSAWVHVESNRVRAELGKLFINGQIYRFQDEDKGDRSRKTDFWGGIEGVTIVVNNVTYEMSIDRPPMNKWELYGHVKCLVRAMNPQDLISNLQASEHLWVKLPYSDGGNFFVFLLIENIVSRLGYLGFSFLYFPKYFSDKKYLCLDKNLNNDQKAKLEEEGYVLCPKFFTEIGMPKASAKLSDTEHARTLKPVGFQAGQELFKLSQQCGCKVSYPELQRCRNMQGIGAFVKQIFAEIIEDIRLEGQSLKIVFKRSCNIDKECLVDINHHESVDTGEGIMYFIRGIVYAGLRNQCFEDAYFAQGDFFSTFMVYGHELLVRNNTSSTDDVFLNITATPVNLAEFMEGFKSGDDGERVNRIAAAQDQGKSAGDFADFYRSGLEREVAQLDQRKTELETAIAKIQLELDKKQKEAEAELAIEMQAKKVEAEAELAVEMQAKKAKAEVELAVERRQNKTPIRFLLRPLRAVASVSAVIGTAALAIVALANLPSVFSGTEMKNPEVDTTTAYDGIKAPKIDNPRSLSDILRDFNQTSFRTDVWPSPTQIAQDAYNGILEGIAEALKSLGGALEGRKFSVEDNMEAGDYRIVENPTENQIQQLSLLQELFSLLTHHPINQTLYLFQGGGLLGLNHGAKYIGLHEADLDAEIWEAMSVLTHEVAHNDFLAIGHDSEFIRAGEAIAAALQRRLYDIAATPDAQLTGEERKILQIKSRWDSLISNK